MSTLLLEVFIVVLGVANGALFAMLPDPTKMPHRQGWVWAASMAFGLMISGLPLIVSSERFVFVVMETLVAGWIAYFVTHVIHDHISVKSIARYAFHSFRL